jgi:hypothetical protein
MGARVVTVNEVLGGHVRLESRPDAWRYGNPRSGSRPRPAGCRSGLSRGRPGAPLVLLLRQEHREYCVFQGTAVRPVLQDWIAPAILEASACRGDPLIFAPADRRWRRRSGSEGVRAELAARERRERPGGPP